MNKPNLNIISHILLSLGNTPNKKGFYFIKDCIIICLYNSTAFKSKEIYAAVADKYNTTLCSVERAIRYTIQSSWHNRDKALASQIFGCSVSINDVPSNTLYIAAIVDHLRR